MSWTSRPRRTASRMVQRLRKSLRGTPGAAILMYHRIAEETFDPWGLAVAPNAFLSQMEWLAANRPVLSLTEFAERCRAGTLPADATAITFDDGYASTAQVALPLLERLRIPATIFVPPDLIEGGREFWWDELEQIILNDEGPEVKFRQETIALGRRSPKDRTWLPAEPPRTPRQKVFRLLWARLRTMPPAAQQEAMYALAGPCASPAVREAHRPLTPAEARSIQSRLVEFGSHALAHPSLPHLPPREKERQIFESLERCAKVTGRSPRTFAYPYGDVDEESMIIVESAGFVGACTTRASFVGRRSSPFALPRIQVGNWTGDKLRRELGGP